jgi:hypothetical protein
MWTTRGKILAAALGCAGVALVLLIVLGVGGFFVGRSVHRNSRLEPFRKNKDKYLFDNHEGHGGHGIYKKGKVLPIDENAKDVDPIYFDLPDDVVAQTPDEVGVVVRIKWATQPVRNKQGVTRPQDFCLISVYDADGWGLDGVLRMTGPMPQLRGVQQGPDTRSLKTKVVEWMKTLKPNVPISNLRPDNRPDDEPPG